MSPSPWFGAPLLLLGSFVPGYLLSIFWRRDWTDSLDLSEALFVQLVSGLILNSWLLLFLAEFGLFSLHAIVLSWIAVCVLLGWFGRDRLRDLPLLQLQPSRLTIAVAALLVVAVALFARPAESFLVLDDSGIYVLGGIQLAKTGSLFISDPALASFSPETAKEILFTGPYSAAWTRLWGQFFVWNWYKPWVHFGLLDMQRIWCGLFTLFLGTYGGLWVAPAFGLVAMVGLCLLGRRLFSPATGLLGAALLTLNLAQIWHARYPVSEMLGQAFVLGGFYLLALCIKKQHVGLSVVSGLCLGGLFLVRVDAILAGVLLLGLALWWYLTGKWQRVHSAFALALGLALAYASLHNAAWNWGYFISLWRIAGSPTLTRVLALCGVCLGSVVLVAVLKQEAVKALIEWLSTRTWQLTAAATAALVALISLHYTFSTAGWQGRPIIWLAQYWTPLGLCLAGGGLILVMLRHRNQLALPFLVTALAYLALFLLDPMVNPVQPWAMRRFMPTILPALALLTAYAISMLPSVRFQVPRIAQVLTVAALAIPFVRMDQPFLSYREYDGMAEQLEQLAARFEENAVILFNYGDPSLYISQPLFILHDLNAFVLQRPTPDPAVMNPLIERWHEQGAPVYLALGAGALDWHPAEWAFLSEQAFTLHITRIQRSFGQPPTGIQNATHTLDIYRVVPRNATTHTDQPLAGMLDMAMGEYPYLRGGFHAFETATDGVTYRWTNGSARIQLPRVGDNDMQLRLRVAGGRPSGVEEAHLSIVVNGTAVAQADMAAGFSFQTVESIVPGHLLGNDHTTTSVALESNTWIPAASGHGSDPRELGVIVDWITWEAARTQQ